jgi:hypothetical protein
MKIEVGQILYREVSYRNQPTEIKELVVTKVGNKYLYVEGYEDYPISKETLMYVNKDYSQNNYQVYVSKQVILDKREEYDLTKAIKDIFPQYGYKVDLSLGQLRAIKDIIDNKF